MSRLLFAAAAATTITVAAPAAAQNQSGPMTIERIQSGPAGAPEVKITDVDGHLSTLLGGEAGWMTESTLFVGAAGYWMVNGAHDQGMGYGGLTLHWWWNGNQRFGIGAKGLVGGGTATLLDTFTQRVPIPPYPVPVRGGAPATQTYTYSVWYNRGFFIFEPEGDAFVKLSDHLRVTGGVSYRVIGADGNTDNRIRGVAATIGVQIF
ncbi:MAG TPA: hypothetical protein VF219_18770 [Vicinamibacterales bacterium]